MCPATQTCVGTGESRHERGFSPPARRCCNSLCGPAACSAQSVIRHSGRISPGVSIPLNPKQPLATPPLHALVSVYHAPLSKAEPVAGMTIEGRFREIISPSIDEWIDRKISTMELERREGLARQLAAAEDGGSSTAAAAAALARAEAAAAAELGLPIEALAAAAPNVEEFDLQLAAAEDSTAAAAAALASALEAVAVAAPDVDGNTTIKPAAEAGAEARRVATVPPHCPLTRCAVHTRNACAPPASASASTPSVRSHVISRTRKAVEQLPQG